MSIDLYFRCVVDGNIRHGDSSVQALDWTSNDEGIFLDDHDGELERDSYSPSSKGVEVPPKMKGSQAGT